MRLIRKQLPRLQNIGMMGLASKAATPDGFGARLSQLRPDFPAAKAGLQEGDTVLELAGLDVTQIMYEEIPLYQPVGLPVPIKVQRGGEVLEVSVTPVSRD